MFQSLGHNRFIVVNIEFLIRHCVFSSPLCWCARFGDWIVIDNIGREKGSTRRDKTAFALSVSTIFVLDCSTFDHILASTFFKEGRWDANFLCKCDFLLSFQLMLWLLWFPLCLMLYLHFPKRAHLLIPESLIKSNTNSVVTWRHIREHNKQ